MLCFFFALNFTTIDTYITDDSIISSLLISFRLLNARFPPNICSNDRVS